MVYHLLSPWVPYHVACTVEDWACLRLDQTMHSWLWWLCGMPWEQHWAHQWLSISSLSGSKYLISDDWSWRTTHSSCCSTWICSNIREVDSRLVGQDWISSKDRPLNRSLCFSLRLQVCCTDLWNCWANLLRLPNVCAMDGTWRPWSVMSCSVWPTHGRCTKDVIFGYIGSIVGGTTKGLGFKSLFLERTACSSSAKSSAVCLSSTSYVCGSGISFPTLKLFSA